MSSLLQIDTLPCSIILKSTIEKEVRNLDVLLRKFPYKARVLMTKLIEKIILKPEIKKTCLDIEIFPRNEIITHMFNKSFFLLVGGAGFEPATSTV